MAYLAGIQVFLRLVTVGCFIYLAMVGHDLVVLTAAMEGYDRTRTQLIIEAYNRELQRQYHQQNRGRYDRRGIVPHGSTTT